MSYYYWMQSACHGAEILQICIMLTLQNAECFIQLIPSVIIAL